MLLAQKQYEKKIKESSNVWNFGPNKNNFITVDQIINKIKKIKKLIIKKSTFKETEILKLNIAIKQ